jgi:hypothetical protein
MTTWVTFSEAKKLCRVKTYQDAIELFSAYDIKSKTLKGKDVYSKEDILEMIKARSVTHSDKFVTLCENSGVFCKKILESSDQIKKRKCLRCGVEFKSSSYGNRICGSCNKTNSKTSVTMSRST